ncbi:MAG: hypothetical protein EOM90_13880 [Alphaproteobacteria bacterium]|nr:hypothetical protein [Alphaproteobacteria bacterium]
MKTLTKNLQSGRKLVLCFFLTMFTMLSFSLSAQNLLNKPEHVAWDQVNHRYLVTNYGNGKIVAIDTLGNQQVAIEGIPNCLGIHIVDTTIFITQGTHIHLYGLQSLAPLQTLTLYVSNWIDGMTNDSSGNLYAAENSGKVHKVRLSDLTDTVIVNGGLPSHLQDLAYDPVENRLLLVCWGTNSPIVAIDLETYAVSDLVTTTSGQYDGIVRDTNGDLYVTSWMSGGRVYKWEPPYTSGAEIFSQGHAGPAGLALNEERQMLAVPNFNGNTVTYLSLIPTGVVEQSKKPEIRIEGDQLVVNSSTACKILITAINGKQVFMESYGPGEIILPLKSALATHNRGFYILTVYTEICCDSVKYYFDKD